MGFWAAIFVAGRAQADDELALTGTNVPAGLFHGLDARSAYFRDFFPTPLLVDETSLEGDGELELGSQSTRAGVQRSDTVTAAFQKSFGVLTVELAVPYEWESDSDDSAQGVGNLELGARYPLYQWVSAAGGVDTTMGVAMNAEVPVNSAVSENTELDPEVFNDLRIGDHFSLQSVFGYSTLLGGGSGLQTFEYGFDFGWPIPHRELPLPGVRQFTPMFELSGETELNQGEAGQNNVLGSLGFRLALKPWGGLDPDLGIGYLFPLDAAAREEVHWGIATSLTLEF